VIQGRFWQTDAPWIVSIEAAKPYWLVRTLSGIPLAGGFIFLLLGLTTGPRGAGLESIAASGNTEPAMQIRPRLAVDAITTSGGV
jgi:hypothetical protein